MYLYNPWFAFGSFLCTGIKQQGEWHNAVSAKSCFWWWGKQNMGSLGWVKLPTFASGRDNSWRHDLLHWNGTFASPDEKEQKEEHFVLGVTDKSFYPLQGICSCNLIHDQVYLHLNIKLIHGTANHSTWWQVSEKTDSSNVWNWNCLLGKTGASYLCSVSTGMNLENW